MSGCASVAVDPLSVPHDAAAVEAFFARHFPRGKIERVLLVNPPDGESGLFRFATARRKRYPNYPPYGLGVLAQHLRAIGVEPKIVNLNDEVLKAARAAASKREFDFDRTWQAALDDAIAGFKPDLIGVTCMFTMTHASLKRVCEHAALSGIPVAIGGVHVNNDVERVLDDIKAARIAFLREGDVAIKLFCRAVGGELGPTGLGQVILDDGRERFRFLAQCQPTAGEIDVIPAYDLFNVRDLSKVGVIGNFHGFKPPGTRFATVLSNRGCRAQCTFCSVRNFNGKAVRQRSVDSVLDELELLKNEHGIGHFVWLDDDLLKDHARAIALFNGMVKRRLGMTWDATNGLIAASCTDEIVHAMAESGCIALNIGMESGNPVVLRQIKKPGTVRTFLAAAEVLRRYEQIHSRVFLMIGFPGETLAMINDTINVARHMDLDWCGITPLQPLPNTPIYDSMVEQGLIQNVGSSEVRFMAGGYGKQDEIDLGLRLATVGFEEAFCAIPMDAVPTPQQITDIWFYMNYHLNFHRLFSEDRPAKIEQQLKNLNTLRDVISPEHGLALYFIGYLQHKLDGTIEPGVIDRLQAKLDGSNYWRERLEAFGLAVDDLRTRDFKGKEIPRLLPGQPPRDERRYEDLVFEA
ncbi:MAG: B12-binding domain-containing radical SAM protein [Pseudomonadota bacterium]